MIVTTELLAWLLCILIIVDIGAEILWSALVQVVIPWYRAKKEKM